MPRLVRGGHEVIAISRGTRDPYHASREWGSVRQVTVDRDAEDEQGTFGTRILALRPDVVIDLICFTTASARQLVDALRPSRPLLIHCGTIWVHGPALRVPVTEDEPRTAYGEYGTGKAEIEALLHRETLAGGVPAVVLHPGHISGPGWPVITPAWATLIPPSGPTWPRACRSRCPITGWACCTTCTRTTWRRPSSGPSPGRRDRASFHVVAEQANAETRLAAGAAVPGPVLESTDWAEFERRAGAEHAETTRQHPTAASPRASAGPGREQRLRCGLADRRVRRRRSTSAAQEWKLPPA